MDKITVIWWKIFWACHSYTCFQETYWCRSGMSLDHLEDSALAYIHMPCIQRKARPKCRTYFGCPEEVNCKFCAIDGFRMMTQSSVLPSGKMCSTWVDKTFQYQLRIENLHFVAWSKKFIQTVKHKYTIHSNVGLVHVSYSQVLPLILCIYGYTGEVEEQKYCI